MAEITTLLNPRAQNVPKSKVERMKLVEITGDQKGSLGRTISTKLLLLNKKPSNSIQKSQAGRHGLDPRRPLQISPANSANLNERLWPTLAKNPKSAQNVPTAQVALER